MASIATKKTMSILANDLIGNINFDISQTIPAMDISSDQYNEGMKLYLQMRGVKKIDAEYNAAVRQFETQLEEQELSAKLQANLAAESAANIAVEAQPNLGTGASAVASEGMQSALEAAHTGIEQNVIKTYQEEIQEFSEQYTSKLESILGEYDPVTKTFAGLVEYQTNANKATEALMKVLAISLKPGVDTASDEYIDVLISAGFVEKNSNGVVTLSDAGQTAIDKMVNNVEINEPNAALGGKTLIRACAEQMAMSEYSYADDDGNTLWESLSPEKRSASIREYESWIFNNLNNLRVSSWQLYEETESGIIIDTEYSTPRPDTGGVGVDSDTGVAITKLTAEVVSAEDPNYFGQIKTDIASGKIADGSYIIFSASAEKNNKFYYVYQGYVYETAYTVENPPEQIDVNKATTYSFGHYAGTSNDADDVQNEWVQEIIDSAKAGRIPDGTYIQMNYGVMNNRNTGWYIYENGVFKKVSSDTKVTVKDRGSGRQHDVKLSSVVYKEYITSNILYNAGFWGSAGESDQVSEYLDW